MYIKMATLANGQADNASLSTSGLGSSPGSAGHMNGLSHSPGNPSTIPMKDHDGGQGRGGRGWSLGAAEKEFSK